MSDLLRHSLVVRKIPWERYRVKKGAKGPFVWEAKCVPLWIKDENGLPDGSYPLLIARSVLNPERVKFFLSNAPLDTPVETLLLVAFSRWHIERMFEDSKGELGMDHFEVRRYPTITRHLLLTCVSHLFLAKFVKGRQRKNPARRTKRPRRSRRLRTDRVPVENRDSPSGPALAARRSLLAADGRRHRRAIEVNAAPQRGRRPQPMKTNAAAIMGGRNTTTRSTHLSLADNVGL